MSNETVKCQMNSKFYSYNLKNDEILQFYFAKPHILKIILSNKIFILNLSLINITSIFVKMTIKRLLLLNLYVTQHSPRPQREDAIINSLKLLILISGNVMYSLKSCFIAFVCLDAQKAGL